MKKPKLITVVKIVLLIVIIIIAVSKINFSTPEFTKAYTGQPSYYQNEEIHFFASSGIEQKGIQITTLSGKKVCFVKGKFSYQKPQKDAWKNGFGYKQTQERAAKDFKPGIYLINGTYPFVIKGDTNKHYDITVVFPYGTMAASQPSGGYNLYGWGNGIKKTISHISLNKPVHIDKISLSFSNFLDSLNQKYKVNYITDLDMDNYTNIKNTNALLFFGRNDFWTFKQKDNYMQFLKNGKNVIFFCTYCMEKVYWYNQEKKTLSRNKNINVKQNLLGWNEDIGDSLMSFRFVGFNEYYGGTAFDSTDGFHILTPRNPIFKDCHFKDNIIPIMSNLYTGIHLLHVHPFIVNNQLDHFATSQVLAYANVNQIAASKYPTKLYGLMLIVQPKSAKGFIISMGTDAWCYKYNWKRKNIRQVMLNAIDYAVKGH